MRRLLVLANLAILACLIGIGRQMVTEWRGFEAENTVVNLAKSALAGAGTEPETILVDSATATPPAPFPDFLVVADRNLFSPERRPPSEEVQVPEVQVPQPPPLPVKPTLNGVLSMRGEKQAFLTVYSGNKSQGQPRTVRVGDMVEGYQVSEITEGNVRLTWNDHHVLVERDAAPASQKERSSRATAAVNIIKVGTAVAAVETTSSTEAATPQPRGLEVGVVSSPAQPGARPTQRGMGSGNQGLANRGGANPNTSRGLIGVPSGPLTERPGDNR